MLDFEKPLFEIRNKIESLKESQDKNDVDLQEEIDMLEASLERETKKIYTNLKPWDRVQIARLQERPTTLDYIPYIFDSFMELHGDRNFRDDPAMIGGIGFLNVVLLQLLDNNVEKIQKIIFIEILVWRIQKVIEKHYV